MQGETSARRLGDTYPKLGDSWVRRTMYLLMFKLPQLVQ